MKLFNKLSIALLGAAMAIGVSFSVAANRHLESASAATEEITLVGGTNATASTVNGKAAMKIGTSSKNGSFTATLPAGTTSFQIYASAWSGKTATLSITGASCSPSSLSLPSGDTGFSGNSTSYTLSGNESNFVYTVTTTNITTAKTITFTSGSKERAVAWSMTATVPGSTEPDTITIDKINGGYTLDNDTEGHFKATYSGSKTLNNGFYYIWSSSNEDCILIDSEAGSGNYVYYDQFSTGIYFYAGAVGKSTIKAELYNSSGKLCETSQEFTVTARTISVTGVTLNENRVDCTVGDDPVTLTATVAPSNATNKAVTWSSDDTTVVSVDNGVVTIVGEGIATVTVNTVDSNKTADCVFHVEAGSVIPVGDETTFNVGVDTSDTTSITKGAVTIAQTSGSNAYLFNRTDEYRLYQGSFTVSSTGNAIVGIEFTSTANGDASYGPKKISTTQGNYETSTSSNIGTWTGEEFVVAFEATAQFRATKIVVTLSNETPTDLGGVILDRTFEVLKPNSGVTLTATTTPTAVTGVTVTWTSSDTTVATVNNGVVSTTSKLGFAIITVTATKGSNTFTAKCGIANVQHAGTQADPFDTVDAVNVANATGDKATASKYYVTGTVATVSITSSYANATLVDNDTTLTLYRFYDVGSTNVSFTDTTKIKVGDTIVVYSPIVNFNNATPETTGGNLVSVVSNITLTSVEIRGEVTIGVTVGDLFNLSELKVYAIFSNGTETDVTKTATIGCSPERATTAGTETIRVSASFDGMNATSRTFDVTVQAASSTLVTDTLTRATTEVANGTTSYSGWSGKSVTSTAVYAGNSAGGNGAIQLRSNNNNSGIVTTASGGLIKKVAVVWGSSTASGRTINVYGSNSPFTDPTQLYNVAQGSDITNIGTIVYGTSTELTIAGEYTYVGIRSSNGALYLDSVTFSWETSGSSTVNVSGVTLNKTSTTLDIGQAETLTATVAPSNATNKNVTWTSNNENVATVENGVVSAVAQGSATITVTTVDGGFTATCSVTVNGGSSVTEEGTFNFRTIENVSGTPTDDEITWASGDVTAVATKNSGTKVTNYYPGTAGATYAQTRLYKGNTLEISVPSGYAISKIEMTIDSTNYGGLNVESAWTTATSVAAQSGSIVVNVPALQSVTAALTGTIRLFEMTVTYAPVSGNTDLDDAIEWAQNFVTALTCDNGNTAPSTSTWSAQATVYAALSDGAKTIIVSATYTRSGYGASTVITAGDGVDQDIAEAVAKYDYVIAKYGTTNYSNFITRSVASNNLMSFSSTSNEGMMLVILAVSLIGLTTVGCYFYLRKRKED